MNVTMIAKLKKPFFCTTFQNLLASRENANVQTFCEKLKIAVPELKTSEVSVNSSQNQPLDHVPLRSSYLRTMITAKL